MAVPPVTTTSPRLAGSRVIVTGGARGIGGAIAARFAAEGARVAILDLLRVQGAATAHALGATFVDVDLASPDDTARAMSEAIDTLGGLDILVNSAGVFRLTPLLDIDAAEWDRVMSINARGTLLTMQAAARQMMDQAAGGSIINIASMAAKKGGANEAHYAASKSAVVALTRAAALEWGHCGIRVNAICPGFVLTEMGAATRTPEQIAEWSSWSPLGRLGEADDVAAAALFLASTDSAYVTGQALNVTGGMVMH